MAIFNQVVSGGGSAPEHYIQKAVVNGELKSGGNVPRIDLTGVQRIGDMQLIAAYRGNLSITGTALVNANSLYEIGERGLEYAFSGCTGITSTGLDNVQLLTFASLSNAFAMTHITQTGLSNLISVVDSEALLNTFMNCRYLTDIDMDNLSDVSGWASFGGTFQDCTSLVTATFTSLWEIHGDETFQGTFNGCTSLTTVSFPALGYVTSGEDTWEDDSTTFSDMLTNCTGVTVHFPANLESYIGSWYDVVNGFGGTNTTVLFDLPDVELGYPTEPEEPEEPEEPTEE